MVPMSLTRIAAAGLAAALLMLTAAPARAEVPDTDPGALTSEAVDAYVSDYLDASPLPGAAVAVTRGTEVVRAAGYGTDSAGGAITADTPMGVASVSKAFTALAVMQLVEDGALALDDRVARHLPGFTLDDPRADRVTVRQLLTHTSGMSDTAFREKSAPAAEDLEGALARMADSGMAADPGTEFHYHNPNYHVAARLVEVLSGRSFGEYMDERVFAPLGMDDTVTVDTAEEVFAAGAAPGHVAVLGAAVAVPEPQSYFNGAGGMVTTAHDMARWLVAQNNGGRGADGARVLSEEGITATHTPVGGAGGDTALGWNAGESPAGAPMVSHGGIQFTYTAHQALLPGSGYGVAVMANTGLGSADASALLHGLVALAEGGEPAAPTAPVLLALDLVLVALVGLTGYLAQRGVRRAGAWAEAVRVRPRWRGAVRLLPGLAVIGAAVFPNRLAALLAQGRDMTWGQTFYLAPTALALLVAAALAFAVVYAARAARLVGARRSVRGRPLSPGGA
ncbi:MULTISPECIES: serine hydrolase domain-containing protein [Nocardiopsis]|uniref:Beta-lactamase n=2 Tax=Nocardiopsis TaxID=2013 RepID=D7B1L6_NOCDD|nr:beta-lactamase [Nocardiopsis dassonvillei subsp. dassonvillei DSM 43111]APC36536.1 serine hydrolase [Nocardiopsis dassonvillei]NKY82067.1 beta-lactamase family protein [Nocardiopsis dassonvillei]VEI88947.1 D-alanyl-D-alanine carboxypeptidase precursor [Nocardiopsis dassonvillei]